MRRLDPDDNGRRVKRRNRPISSEKADRPKPVQKSGDDHRESRQVERESVRGDEARIEGNRHRRAQALDREVEETDSNPSGSREQTRIVSDVSRRVTDNAPRFGSADAAEHHAQTQGDSASDADPVSSTGPEIDYASYEVDTEEEAVDEESEETPPSDSAGEADASAANEESNFRGNEVRRFGPPAIASAPPHRRTRGLRRRTARPAPGRVRPG